MNAAESEATKIIMDAMREAAAALEARDAEIARLREALGAAADALHIAAGKARRASQAYTAFNAEAAARAALAPPPASDGGEA